MEELFSSAYPDLDSKTAMHKARNITQVITGTIELGARTAGTDTPIRHMDVANVLAYWVIGNTYLDNLHTGDRNPELGDVNSPTVSDGEMAELYKEFSARIADFLLGLRLLEQYSKTFEAFVRGSMAIGTGEWPRDRGALDY